MNEKTKILEMLAAGKISVADAEKLLAAVGESASAESSAGGGVEGKKTPKFLRVEVKSNKKDKGPETVNVRVPFQLLRAGVKLAALMPEDVQGKVTSALGEKGIQLDLTKARGNELEALIEQLQDLSIDVDSEDEKVRVFME
jgi:hypothetical protein